MDEKRQENAQERPKESIPPKKKWYHFFLVVFAAAVLLMLMGNFLGVLLLLPIERLLPNASDGVQFILLNYFPFIGIVILVLLYCALAEKPIFRSFRAAVRGGQSGNTAGRFGIGLLIGFAANAICVAAALLHGDIHLYAGRFEPLYQLFALLIICIQSGAEELLTRGYMMGALRERYGVWAAAILNSLFFAALHLLNDGINELAIMNLVLFGLAMSAVNARADSLWACVAIHMAWNYSQNIFFGLPNSGLVSAKSFLHLEAARDSLIYDTVFGVEAAVPAQVVLLVLIVAALTWGHGKSRAAGTE